MRVYEVATFYTMFNRCEIPQLSIILIIYLVCVLQGLLKQVILSVGQVWVHVYSSKGHVNIYNIIPLHIFLQAIQHICSFSSFQLAQRTGRVKSWTRETEDSLAHWTSASQFIFLALYQRRLGYHLLCLYIFLTAYSSHCIMVLLIFYYILVQGSVLAMIFGTQGSENQNNNASAQLEYCKSYGYSTCVFLKKDCTCKCFLRFFQQNLSSMSQQSYIYSARHYDLCFWKMSQTAILKQSCGENLLRHFHVL